MRHLHLHRPSAATIISLIALFFAMSGTAVAATGGNFILGKANTATSTSALTNTKGTALKLVAPPGDAPLQVSNSIQIPRLNASELGGLTTTGLAVTGGDGFTAPNANIPMPTAHVLVEAASTGPLKAGTYYVNATGLLLIQPADIAGSCVLLKGSNLGGLLAEGGNSGTGVVQTAETVAVQVNAGDSVQEWCAADGSNSTIQDAGITAIRILNSSGTPPAITGKPIKATAPRLAH